jgi:hypothetical protein
MLNQRSVVKGFVGSVYDQIALLFLKISFNKPKRTGSWQSHWSQREVEAG